MKKINLQSILIIVLILLNAGTLFMLWNRGGKPPGPPHGMPPHEKVREYLKTELNLSEEQEKIFVESQKKHREKSEEFKKNIMEEKKALFKLLDAENLDSVAYDAHLQKIVAYHQAFEESIFKHFAEFKNNCNAEQKIKFGKIAVNIPEMMIPPRPPKKEHD